MWLNHAALRGFSSGREDLTCAEQRPEAHGAAREPVGATLLAVDHAHRGAHLQPGIAQRVDGLAGGAAGGDDVLDEHHAAARFEGSFDAFRGAVGLRLAAHDQERETPRERGGGRERDRAELRPGEELGAVALAASASLAGGLPFLIVRGEAKAYGTANRIEGAFEPGRRVVLVEDVVTSGGAACEAVDALREAGLEVRAAVCVVDREEGGADGLARRAVRLWPLFRASEILAA